MIALHLDSQGHLFANGKRVNQNKLETVGPVILFIDNNLCARTYPKVEVTWATS